MSKKIPGLMMLGALGLALGCVTPAGVDDSYIGSVEQTRDQNTREAEDQAREEREREEFERNLQGIEEQRAR